MKKLEPQKQCVICKKTFTRRLNKTGSGRGKQPEPRPNFHRRKACSRACGEILIAWGQRMKSQETKETEGVASSAAFSESYYNFVYRKIGGNIGE